MTNFGKPALIVASRPSNWTSNRVISPNLQEAYRLFWKSGFAVHKLSTTTDESEIHALARVVAATRPERLVFIDHLPHPATVIKHLVDAWKGRPLPPLYFHLYGDFTLYLKSWLNLETFLKGAPVRWICASDRQAALVSRLISKAGRSIAICPFPVDPSVFGFDSDLRKSARGKFGFTNEDSVLCYTGRFSLQKNSVRLLREAATFMRTAGPRRHLLLAGSFDDIGAPFFGIRHLQGYYYQLWNQMLQGLPQDILRRIRYLGRLDSAQLRELYHASDCYFSLSLHHDEDFGMAPAEAMSCGNSAVLTDWGGFTSFRKASAHCSLIPIMVGNREFVFSSREVQSALRVQCRAGTTSEERRRRSARFLVHFSIASAAETLRQIHHCPPPRFHGFDALLRRLCSALDGGAYFFNGPSKSTLYPRLYSAYYGKTSVLAA